MPETPNIRHIIRTGLYIVPYGKGLEKGKEKEGGKKRKKRKLGENITFGSKKS